MRRAWPALLVTVALSACAPLPSVPGNPPGTEPPATPLPAGTATSPSPAPSPSAVLIEQAREQRSAGELPAAAASLERAIRIEPSNPWLWLELAEVHLDDGNVRQAEAHARKALGLAATVDARRAAETLLERVAAR